MMKPVASFRVSFRGWICEVVVWPSLKGLRQAFERAPGRKAGHTRAFCRAYERRIFPANRLTREFAEVHFTRRELGTMILTHEFTHAGMAILRRKGWIEKLEVYRDADSVSAAEEYLCDAVGEFMRQAVKKLYALKLIG